MSIVKVIMIDDNYIYQNYPLPQKMDRETLLSIIKMEQVTSIQDLLGSSLYEDLEQKVYDENLTDAEAGLFNLVKYSLCLYCARGASALLRSSIGVNKNEEKSLNQYGLDAIMSSIDSKISYINTRIINYIKADAVLLAKAKESGNDIFDENDNYISSVYYPHSPLSDECQ